MVFYKYAVVVFLIIALGVGVYMWHQARKSNHEVRSTDTSDLTKYSLATFAGGCFWCVESDFEKVDGVVEVISGYTGGHTENPAYNEVSGGSTGHREAVQVYYDATIVSYERLLDVFWTHVNPTDNGGQFADRGFEYSTAIFYHTDEQKSIAEASKAALDATGKLEEGIVTEILPVQEFYIAEDYHQDYYSKNPLPYKYYREGSGRNDFIRRTWGSTADDVIHGKACVTNVCATASTANQSAVPQEQQMSFKDFKKPDDAKLKAMLTPLQYKVTQREGTETPFDNEYWNNHEEGIYVDIVSGEPLFSSTDKFDSGTGWPSFLKPIAEGVVTEHDDYKLLVKRIEIRSAIADSHLGHIIMDGPESNNFVRYCMNSASLRFIPKESLAGSEYEQYLSLFN
jgi:peptide methionine sulfoxide reductase msrA/msrB